MSSAFHVPCDLRDVYATTDMKVMTVAHDPVRTVTAR